MSISQDPAALARDIIRELNHGIKPVKRALRDQLAEDAAYLERLRAYATTWLEAGYRLDEWSMRPVLQSDIQAMTNVLVARSDGQPFVITLPGQIRAEREATNGEPPAQEGRFLASQVFVDFLTGPHYAHIGRCSRCQTWFFTESGKRTRYCSTRCARLDTSNVAKTATRERLVLLKLVKIQEAINAFEKLPKEDRMATLLKPRGWKGWVAKKAGKDITTNFITRAVNEGRIQPPKDTQL